VQTLDHVVRTSCVLSLNGLTFFRFNWY